jgi:hypothetical protein
MEKSSATRSLYNELDESDYLTRREKDERLAAELATNSHVARVHLSLADWFARRLSELRASRLSQ